MSWVDEITNPQGLRAIFGGDPSSLSGVSVHEVTMDRDGPTVRIRLDLASYPAEPPSKWRVAGFNTVQVELLLGGISDLVVNGLSTEMTADIDLRNDDGLVVVSVVASGMRLVAVCVSVTISGIVAYCDGSRAATNGPGDMIDKPADSTGPH